MKIFFYTLRPWDERPCAERLAAATGIEFDGCEAYPDLENAALAAGCDAVLDDPLRYGPGHGPAVPRARGEIPLLPLHRLRPRGPADRPRAGDAGVQRGLSAPRGGKLCHHADDDEPAPCGPHPQAGRGAGLLFAGQDRPRPVRLHGGRHRHRAHRPHGCCSTCPASGASCWPTTFTPTRRPRSTPGMSISTPCAPRATSSPCTPTPPPRNHHLIRGGAG